MESGQGPQQSPQRNYVPPWLQTPRGATPGVLALELLLARTEKVAVAIPRLYGYPEGFEIELQVVSGADGRELDTRLHRASRAGRLQPDAHGRLPAEMLRLAVKFADGSSVTNVTPFARDPTRKPDGPMMQAQGGGGGAGNWRQRLWVWPLPPPGRLTFICEWPALGIPLARRTIDAQNILDAAARSQALFADEHLPLPPWPDHPEPHVADQPFIF